MTINPNKTTASCSGSDDRHPLLMPDVVLQEARELHRYWLKENNPYSAGVVADCIATIENLQGRTTQASAPRSASAGLDALKAAERELTDLARPICATYNRTTKKYEFDDDSISRALPGTWSVIQQIRAALASNPLEGKGIQSKTEQTVSGLRSPEHGGG